MFCSTYLLSVNNILESTDKDGNIVRVPAKIVCVRNRSNRKDWLAMLCTDTALSEEDIIQIYGKRWDIEVFFKTCKDMLKLEKGCQSLSYDAMTAYVSIVFTRYMLIAVETRTDKDDRTGGEIFFMLCDEMEDISFNRSLMLILQAVFEVITGKLCLDAETCEKLMEEIVSHLPAYMSKRLQIPCP